MPAAHVGEAVRLRVLHQRDAPLRGRRGNHRPRSRLRRRIGEAAFHARRSRPPRATSSRYTPMAVAALHRAERAAADVVCTIPLHTRYGLGCGARYVFVFMPQPSDRRCWLWFGSAFTEPDAAICVMYPELPAEQLAMASAARFLQIHHDRDGLLQSCLSLATGEAPYA